jgi:hypothetical protein
LLAHFDEDGNKLSIYDLLNGRLVVNGYDLSDPYDSPMFEINVVGIHVLNKFSKLIQRIFFVDETK